MLLQRVDFLFDVTTDPADRNSASAHSGGWWKEFGTLPQRSLSQWCATDRDRQNNFREARFPSSDSAAATLKLSEMS